MLRVQTSPVRFLEATNWYSPGDRTICIAVSCTPKFTTGIVFALLCLFSNMPFKLEEFNLRVNIAVKTCADRKYCGFILFFSFSDFQFSKSGPQKSLMGYRPRGCQESNMTEPLRTICLLGVSIVKFLICLLYKILSRYSFFTGTQRTAELCTSVGHKLGTESTIL